MSLFTDSSLKAKMYSLFKQLKNYAESFIFLSIFNAKTFLDTKANFLHDTKNDLNGSLFRSSHSNYGSNMTKLTIIKLRIFLKMAAMG